MCGLENDWPNGRAIFYNDDLSFVVKVNGEDHLNIEYSQKNTHIHHFFLKKFLKISLELEDKLGMSMDEKLGYVTTLPEKLGTSMKTQIIMKVPNLKNKTEISKSKADIEQQQSNLSELISENESHILNIKGDGSKIGETLEQDQVSILSVEKIGTSNRQAIHKLKVSINRLIDRENMYNNKQIINKKNEMKSYEHLFVKKQDNYNPRGLQKYLTKPIWQKYREMTSKDGVKFIDCVYPGIKEIGSNILLCAGSKDCYSDFAEVFNPYIKDYHGHNANQPKIKSEMNY